MAVAFARTGVAIGVAAVVSLGGCGKTESSVMFRTQEGFSKSDVRTRDLSPPRAVRRAPLRVPEPCRKAGVVAQYAFEAAVTETGAVESLRESQPAVESPACPGLEEAVRRTLSQSKYEPTLIDGRPARVTLTVTAQLDVR